MRWIDLHTTSIDAAARSLRRAETASARLSRDVARIIARVRQGGDAAVRAYTWRFDRVRSPALAYAPAAVARAARGVDRPLRRAIAHAARNIERVHRAALRRAEPIVRPERGVAVQRVFRPIDRVGIYVPGGSACYPSTVLMCAIPARIAGCREIAIATPPRREGLAPAVAYACRLCGVDTIYAMGGAQAVAALAYGTRAVRAVDLIVGPGNDWVAEAKRQVAGQVGIDMPAGPTEVMIIADGTAEPAWIAADLLAQLEHGPTSQAVLAVTDRAIGTAVLAAVAAQARRLPRRAIIAKSLSGSACVVAQSIAELIDLANAYAPEHLELAVAAPTRWLPRIRHAGSVFVGPCSTEPLGDYVTGANHTLPTGGAARAFGPLGVETFGKWMQIQTVTRAGLRRLAPDARRLAAAEGLTAHARAVAIREETR